MINWTTSEQLAARLSGYPPIGLRLRPFLHAKYNEDPTTFLPTALELRAVDGLGNLKVWNGFVETVPFTITVMAHPRHYGLEVSLPNPIEGHGMLFAGLAALALPRARSIYFETVPPASGFAVMSESEGSIYSAPTNADAIAAAAFAESVGRGPFSIVSLTSNEPRWMVVGPAVGPYVSDMESFTSEAEARRYAAQRSKETGVMFDVRPIPNRV